MVALHHLCVPFGVCILSRLVLSSRVAECSRSFLLLLLISYRLAFGSRWCCPGRLGWRVRVVLGMCHGTAFDSTRCTGFGHTPSRIFDDLLQTDMVRC